MYYISKATLKVANKQYSKVKNDYEMTLHAHSSIVPCDDGHGIPSVNCDFVKIAELENRDKDAIIGKNNPGIDEALTALLYMEHISQWDIILKR